MIPGRNPRKKRTASQEARSETYGSAVFVAISTYHSGTTTTPKHPEQLTDQRGHERQETGPRKEGSHPGELVSSVEVRHHLPPAPEHGVPQRERGEQGQEP